MEKLNSSRFSRTCNPPRTLITWLYPIFQASELRHKEVRASAEDPRATQSTDKNC